ncbi:MAG: toxin-antitoxin system YwqK family antitoxin, partial [Deltaproteobacteria bacterium]|nr:toxin-antitoxin system YwqK family antitoxin [Deltaproteobacteria bacterium]
QTITCEVFDLASRERRLVVDPCDADVEARYLWGRMGDLRVGDLVEVEGLFDEASHRLTATRVLRSGWPRVGLLSACVIVGALIAAVAIVHHMSQREPFCSPGTQEDTQRSPTGVEHLCRRTGTRQGRSRLTDHVGRLIEKGRYGDGLKEGSWWRYHRNGKVAERLDYVAGVRHGRWKKWYPSGSLAVEGHYDHGHGELRVFYECGKVSESGRYLGSKRHGPWRYLRADGTLRARGAYRRGKKHGIWVAYEDDGKTRSWEGAFIAGKRDGPWAFWTGGGIRSKRGRFVGGKREGAWMWWHKNGKIARHGRFHRGKKEGRWVFFDDKGRPQLRGNYRDGLRVGMWRWYCASCTDCDPCKGKGDEEVTKSYDPATLPASLPTQP